jgi:ABC-type oligopeptide transport system substrate-binding subunit
LRTALIQVAGWDPAKITGPADKELKAVTDQLHKIGVTAAEVPVMADRYRQQHPTWKFTLRALAKWWPDLSKASPNRYANDPELEARRAVDAERMAQEDPL